MEKANIMASNTKHDGKLMWWSVLLCADSGLVYRMVRCCIHDASRNGVGNDVKFSTRTTRSFGHKCVLIAFCSSGLLTSFLLWGLLQERIMSVHYDSENSTGPSEHFSNSLFLEFMNRILALVFAVAILLVRHQPAHTAPMYMYSYNALSNVMSSWCQYEALKYISFPVQVLAKAAKVIPVMLMGKVVSRQTYSLLEYITAAMISIGLFMFVISTDATSRSSKASTSTVSGIILLAGYLGFDAFTSNWQGRLFHLHKMSSTQMMAGSNLFAVIFAGVSLAEQGGFVEAMSFMMRHPLFISHVAVMSLTSAVGQLFIYFTISEFGPVTFTIIMTIRQGFAILLSCIIYHHSVGLSGLVGILICFTAIFIRTYRSSWLSHVVQKQPVIKSMQVLVTSGSWWRVSFCVLWNRI